MSNLFTLPRQIVLQPDGTPYANSKAFFYRAGTTTAQAVYQDAALITPHAQPVQAADSGYFPPIYLNPNAVADYRMILTTSTGVAIPNGDIDDIPRYSTSASLTAAAIGAALYPLTATESAASITPTTYIYPDADPRRSETLYPNQNWLNFGDVPTYISTTSLSVPGNQTTRYPFASRVMITNASGGHVYARVQASVYTTLTTLTLTLDNGNVPNPASGLFLAQAMMSDNPGVTRWDLNANSGVFFWNVSNSASATSKVSVQVGQSGLGGDSGMNIAAVGSAHTAEYLSSSGITGAQIVIHTGSAIPIMFGIGDVRRMLLPAIGTPISLTGSAEALALISPREGDSLGGAWMTFYKSVAQGGQRKGYVGFSNDGTNNTLNITNEVAASAVAITATDKVVLSTPNKAFVLDVLDAYADDAAAAVGGVEVGELYRTGSAIKQRVA